MFNMPTSGPLSPTVSLERRKLEQQGIPPGQEQQGSAAKGSPISGDLAQLIQLNRMLQQQSTMQQQANPAPSTVAQDLMQHVMQQRASQMNPRQQGIAQLPQEAVGNGMAAGGIVAFDDGGSVRHFAGGGRPYGDDPNMIYERGIPVGPRLLSNTEPEDEYDYGPAEPGVDIYGRPKRADTIYDSNGIAMGFKQPIGKKPRPKAPEMTPAQVKDTLANAGDMSRIGNIKIPSMVDRKSPISMGGIADTPEVARAIVEAQRAAPASKGQGLKDLVPTLSAPKEEIPSESDILVNKLRAEAAKNPTWYEAERKRMEDAAGLTGIWAKQQAEQDRLKAEANPAAQMHAFWNNLSAQLAGQIGQRGVPLSSRLAQMVGAYGGAKSTTEEEFKKRNAELNKANNDLQEKQAMYRMTGTMADRKAVEQAQKDYLAAVKEAETVKAKASADKIANRRLDLQSDREARQLQINEAREKREADYQKVMADVALGRNPQTELKALATSLNDQLRDISRLIAAETLPDEKAQLNKERAAIAQRLNTVQSHMEKSLGMPTAAFAPTGNSSLVDPSLIAAEKKRRGL